MRTNEQINELASAALAKLREPFPDNQISLLPRPYKKDSEKGRCKECGGWHGLPAVHLRYVGHAALTDRLLDVDPLWNWEPIAYDEVGLPKLDADGGLWIKLTVCGVTRLGYGDAQSKTGNDAMKERIGDALRNAAMRFGAALELWHKGDLHGEDNGDTKQWRMTQSMLDQIKAAWYHPRKKDLADTSEETKRGLFSEWVLDATGVPYPPTIWDWTKEAYEACLAKAEKEKT